MASSKHKPRLPNPGSDGWAELIGSYPHLPFEEKKALEGVVFRALYDLPVPQLRHLLDNGFPFFLRDRSWLGCYLELVEFETLHGHSQVKSTDRNKKLANWVNLQRRLRNMGRLDLRRERALGRIHFIWDVYQVMWEKQCLELKAYVAAAGKVRASRSLQSWISITRRQWGKLPAQKRRQLENLGFPRPCPHLNFANEKYMRELEVRYAQNGDLVGATKGQHTFVRRMRKLNQAGTLDPAFKERLDQVGVVWSARAEDYGYGSVWEMRFGQLEAYLQKCPSAIAPPLREWKNKTLANWVRLQFRDWRHRTPEQQQKVLTLGLKPNPSLEEQWAEQYKRTSELFQQWGPYQRLVYQRADPRVVQWVHRQLTFWTTLSQTRQDQLRLLGIDQKRVAPRLRRDMWDKYYQRAVLYCSATDEVRATYKPSAVRSVKGWLRGQVLAWNRLNAEQRDKIRPLAGQFQPKLKEGPYKRAWHQAIR